MASDKSDRECTGPAQLSIADIIVPYLITTFGLSENEVQTLLAAPTAELTYKFVASEVAKAQAYDKLAQEYTSPCHFMKLPPELRLNIYALVFHDALENSPCREGSNASSQAKRPRGTVRSHHIKKVLSVLHTSRTLRGEAFETCDRLACALRRSMKASLTSIPGWPKSNHRYYIHHLDNCKYLVECQSCYEDVVEICKALQVVEVNMFKSRFGKNTLSRS